MRSLNIVNINPAPGGSSPRFFEVAGNVTQLFHGREWIDASGTRYPFWNYTSSTAPTGTRLLVATTFTVTGNPKYNGSYTVYTRTSSGDVLPSEFVGGNTRIRVIESLPAGSGTELTTGAITDISTYEFTVQGESSILVLEGQYLSTRPVPLIGRYTAGWGEVFQQTMLRSVQNSAGSTAPLNPFVGQIWYNTATGITNIYNGASFTPMNSTLFGAKYTHTQTTAATTWTVTHNLGVRLVSVEVYKNTGLSSPNDVKSIIPLDITYTSATQLTVTFSNNETGTVIVRT
jgi:hypothetical protein